MNDMDISTDPDVLARIAQLIDSYIRSQREQTEAYISELRSASAGWDDDDYCTLFTQAQQLDREIRDGLDQLQSFPIFLQKKADVLRQSRTW